MNIEKMISKGRQVSVFNFNNKVKMSFKEIEDIHPVDTQIFNSDISKIIKGGLISDIELFKLFSHTDYKIPLDINKLKDLKVVHRVFLIYEDMVNTKGYDTAHPVEDDDYVTCFLKVTRKGFVIETTMSLSKSNNIII